MALGILHGQIEVDLLVNVVKEREGGRKNKNVGGGQQANVVVITETDPVAITERVSSLVKDALAGADD